MVLTGQQAASRRGRRLRRPDNLPGSVVDEGSPSRCGADLPEGASVCRWDFAFSSKNVTVATERQAISAFRKNLHFRSFL